MSETAHPRPIMAGKRGLILGVANEKSISWGIASAVAAHGAELAFTYQNDAIRRRVEPLAHSVGSDMVMACDVGDTASLDAAVAAVAARWDRIDFAVHAVAYSDKNELKGRYCDTSRSNFRHTLDISCYSFTALAQRLAPLMTTGGSLVTLTYLGAQRSTPNYNVMGVAKAALEASVRYLAADLGPGGIRVNAISAGPMRTPGRLGDRRRPLHLPLRRERRAVAAQRQPGGSRARRPLSAVGPVVRGDRRDHARRRRLPLGRHSPPPGRGHAAARTGLIGRSGSATSRRRHRRGSWRSVPPDSRRWR